MPVTAAAQEWFSRRRFGLFLHFGIYAVAGWHEQDQMRRRIPRAEYVKLAARFNPAAFNADRILDLAQSVGMEYVCLTTKHHDGFCLWKTACTDFNVMNTPCRRDLVGELADACHRRNFPLGLYYSVVDWHHPNYPNQGRHHEIAGPEQGDRPDWERYMEFLRAQVRELCTNYGTVRHFFWDMNVPQHRDHSIGAMMRSLQPEMVINDRGFDEGDFGTPEREYEEADVARLTRFPRHSEACNSVGTQSWGYRRDEDYYSTAFLIRSIAGIMARGGHYLLNVGPDADGRIPARDEAILRTIGAWYVKVSEAFGDAEPASDLTANRDVLLTSRKNSLYVHLVQPPKAESVVLPPISGLPACATLLNTGKSVKTSVDLLPEYWRKGERFLTIRGLPVDELCGETLIVRLDFDKLPTAAVDATSSGFKG